MGYTENRSAEQPAGSTGGLPPLTAARGGIFRLKNCPETVL